MNAPYINLANGLFLALQKMRADAQRLPRGEARDNALAEWAAADNAEHRRVIRERRAVGKIDNGENEYDADLGQGHRDYMEGK